MSAVVRQSSLLGLYLLKMYLRKVQKTIIIMRNRCWHNFWNAQVSYSWSLTNNKQKTKQGCFVCGVLRLFSLHIFTWVCYYRKVQNRILKRLLVNCFRGLIPSPFQHSRRKLILWNGKCQQNVRWLGNFWWQLLYRRRLFVPFFFLKLSIEYTMRKNTKIA